MLENEIERFSNQNTLFKREHESLKTGTDFQNKWFEEVKRERESDLKFIAEKKLTVLLEIST